MSTSPKPTLYFAYGSNLSPTQMSHRCPNSKFLCLAKLNGWKWCISPRGYANIIKTASSTIDSDVVYGLVYSLSADSEDEENLDAAEGVPWAYEKKYLNIEILPGSRDASGSEIRIQREVLVYVDPRGEGEGGVREEYVDRMNRGIKEAREICGEVWEEEYVREVLRKWIPEE